MKEQIKAMLQRTLFSQDFASHRREVKDLRKTLRAKEKFFTKLGQLGVIDSEIGLNLALRVIENSKSQSGQDLFGIASNNFREGGFFVEVGAANGLDLSNTWLLEEVFNWNGILIEPNIGFLDELNKNRRGQTIVEKAAWSETGRSLEFLEANELSTVLGFEENDSLERTILRRYSVTTTTLTDVFVENNAPRQIDFLSVDTEGTEIEVLKGIDWGTYSFNAIVIEHNFTESREAIREFLEDRGYSEVHADLSMQDSWFTAVDNVDDPVYR